MKELVGKRALVTGASSGIGLALAETLAGKGVNLILTARSEVTLQEIATTLRIKGIEVHVFAEDLSKEGAAGKLFNQIKKAQLSVDLLINNAGFGKWGMFLDHSQETYSDMLQLNINALTELCQLFIPGMIEHGEGGIINVGSTASFVPIPYAAVYSASKAYVLMLSEALHGEFSDQGIHIMTLCPGGTKSKFAEIAGSETNYDSSKSISPYEVAEATIEAFLAGKLNIITGKGNSKVALLPRLLSRKKVLDMVGSGWKKTLGL